MTIAIVGASSDRSKYGNRAVRSYREAGYDVFPVHPKETKIEGLKVYRSVAEILPPLDRVSVYLPPQTGMKVIEEIARKGTKELFLNPGSESDELVAKARSLGLNVIVACSITAIKNQRGQTPFGQKGSDPIRLKCFFCGEELKPGGQPAAPHQWHGTSSAARTVPPRSDLLRCGKCRADFRAKIDPEGCLLSLEVEGCGAEECCRHRPGSRSS